MLSNSNGREVLNSEDEGALLLSNRDGRGPLEEDGKDKEEVVLSRSVGL